MPKPICVPCQRFFRPDRNGVRVLENMPRQAGALPGTQAPQDWKPYKLWQADQWICRGCGATIVTGFGNQPMAIQHEPTFDGFNVNVDVVVNDC